MGYSKIQILGNVGGNSIISEVKNKFVIKFNVAVNTKHVDSDGVISESVIWYNCSYFRPSREKTNLAQYIRKGDHIYIEGIPVITTYLNDKKEVLLSYNVIVTQVELIGASKS